MEVHAGQLPHALGHIRDIVPVAGAIAKGARRAMVEHLPLPQSCLMQHPLSFLFQEPPAVKPLDAQVAKTCTKWDVAQMITDKVHAELQAMPLNNAEDLLRFHRTLVDYAVYTMYAALMKRQLDQLMPGAGVDDYTAVLDKCYGKSPLNDMFREAVNKEIDTEIAPLKEQFQAALAPPPSSWVQRVQQSKTPLQLVTEDGRTA